MNNQVVSTILKDISMIYQFTAVNSYTKSQHVGPCQHPAATSDDPPAPRSDPGFVGPRFGGGNDGVGPAVGRCAQIWWIKSATGGFNFHMVDSNGFDCL